MTFEEWLGDKHLGSMELEFSKDAFVAGAASRDAEIAELKGVFNSTFDRAKKIAADRDQLRDQVTLLRGVVGNSRLLLSKGRCKGDILSVDVVRACNKALAATEPKP